MMQTATSQDCHVIDDHSHGRRVRWCRNCKKPMCEIHWHEEEGQRFCIPCWDEAEPFRKFNEE